MIASHAGSRRTRSNVSTLPTFRRSAAPARRRQAERHAPAAFVAQEQSCLTTAWLRSPVEMKIHRDLKPTRFWSYGPAPYRARLSKLRSGEEVLVEWANELAAAALPAHRPSPARRGARQAAGAHRRAPARRARASRQRRLSGGLVRARQVARSITIPTSRTRRCSGITTTPWASIASTFTPACSARPSLRDSVEDNAQSAQRQVRNSAGDLRPPAHARRPALLSDLRRSRARPGFPRFSATPSW